MAPSTASTVTSIPKPLLKEEKTIRVNGKREGAPVPAQDNDLPRHPIEVKYRDFFWTYTEEPHRTRRLEIIKAHPEARQTNKLSSRFLFS
jgi:sphingolipid delta-4 desaturase